MLRLFIAIQLPEDIRENLALICRGLPGVRWTAPENLHLTLHFLGEVEAEARLDLCDALDSLESPVFELSLNGVGRFISEKKPRALWVGIEKVDVLFDLHKKIERIVSAAGFKADRREFHPHITIARPKTVPEGRLNQYMELYSDFSSSPFEVKEIYLMSSILKPQGAIYREEAVFSFEA